jgi:hypothetical protein
VLQYWLLYIDRWYLAGQANKESGFLTSDRVTGASTRWLVNRASNKPESHAVSSSNEGVSPFRGQATTVDVRNATAS